MPELLIYGQDRTAAEIALEKMGLPVHKITVHPDVWWLVRVRHNDAKIIERYPTKELTRLGAAQWRSIGATVRIQRKEVTK